ncbi:MAG: putative efflux rane protein [Frankiales bacterium]|nr:putative efflux rane protein [Frankiales bacterium]
MTELTPARRKLILAICCMSLLIVGMDNTIVNVALPSIRKDLNASVSGLQWTIDGYTVVLASLLILSGSTADRLGRRRTFQTGLVLFTLGSLLCSLAPGLGWLIAFRMVQAVGGSMLNPVAMSIITNVFTDPRERARAIGVWGGVVGLSLGVGPVVGGLLTETIGWRSIFWINVPIGVAAVILAAFFVPESRAARARRPDPVGQVLVIVALFSLTYAIISGPRLGWGSTAVWLIFGVFVLAMAALLLYEPRRLDPLIDLRFFRSAPFSGATVIAICAFSAFSGFLFLNTLYLQDVRHLSALQAGLFTLPLAAMTLICAPLSGRVVGTRGPRRPLLVAGIAMAVGTLALTGWTEHSNYYYLLGAYVVFGIGFGTVNAPITNTAVSGMPREQAGVAAAIASTSRQIGATLGVAVVGSVAASGLSSSVPDAFVDATRPAWWIITGLGVAVLLLGLATSGAWARESARRTAERLDQPSDERELAAGRT